MISAEALAALPRGARLDAIALLEEQIRRERGRRFHTLFPDETRVVLGQTVHARRLYPRHLEHFAAGATYRDRGFMAANRVGKTTAGAFEITAHLTGLYPAWWEGRRFPHAIEAWAAGKTNETTRDIVQASLVGAVTDTQGGKSVDGTGMLPATVIGDITWKQGVADFVDTIRVQHVSGEWSALGFKSYQQGRGSFEGTAKHCIWLDEESPRDVYDECMVRTATTNGLIMLTFTPLDGLSEVAQLYVQSEDA